jgi:hypothetical protein
MPWSKPADESDRVVAWQLLRVLLYLTGFGLDELLRFAADDFRNVARLDQGLQLVQR